MTVGCTLLNTTFTANSMTVLKALKVNGNRFAAYSITDVAVSPSYCNVTSFTLLNIIPTNYIGPEPTVFMNSTGITSATCTI